MAKIDDFLATRAQIGAWLDNDAHALPVIRLSTGSKLQLVADVPRTRGDCPTERPCPHARCKWHLWIQRGQDGPGRRVNGKAPASTLRPAWLEYPLPPSCGADLADAGEMPIESLSKALGLRPSRVHEILATCFRKLRSAGVDVDELLPGGV